jgi:hypothetical protein
MREVQDPHGGTESAWRRLWAAQKHLQAGGIKVSCMIGDPDPMTAFERELQRGDLRVIRSLRPRQQNHPPRQPRHDQIPQPQRHQPDHANDRARHEPAGHRCDGFLAPTVPKMTSSGALLCLTSLWCRRLMSLSPTWVRFTTRGYERFLLAGSRCCISSSVSWIARARRRGGKTRLVHTRCRPPKCFGPVFGSVQSEYLGR